MHYTNNLKTLGIEEKDFKILKFLFENEENPDNTSSILSRMIDLPRTSVSFRLDNLEKRFLVKNKKGNKERFWSLTQQAKNILRKESKEKIHIEKVEGLGNLVKVFESILENKNNERIYVIEPSGQVEKYQNKVKQGELLKINLKLLDLFKNKEHISETVTGEKSLEVLKTVPKEILKEMWGRATIINLVSDEYLSFSDYILVYFGKVYFLNLAKETGIIVSDKNFAESIKNTIINLTKFGRKINLNEYIKKLLEN